MKKNSTSMTLLTLASAIALTSLFSCTKKEAAPESAAPQAAVATTTQTSTPTANTAEAADKKAETVLTIGTDGDNLYFNKKELDVKAGSTVKLEFKNNSSAASNMNHNWVLVKPGTEQQVATDGMSAGDAKGWVAEGPNVIAHTPLSKPGEVVTVIFTAPPAGDYPYICTFPGHVMTMKGVLKSK